MRIAIDLDGTLRGLMESLQETYKKYNPSYQIQEFTEWEIDKFFPISKSIYEWAFRDHAEEIFYTNARLYPDVQKALRLLKGEGHTLTLLTYQNEHSFFPTCEFIKSYSLDFFFDEIRIILTDTSKVSNGKEHTDYDLYLDDSPHNIKLLLEEGKNVVCMAQPWNKKVDVLRLVGMMDFYIFVLKFKDFKRKI